MRLRVGAELGDRTLPWIPVTKVVGIGSGGVGKSTSKTRNPTAA